MAQANHLVIPPGGWGSQILTFDTKAWPLFDLKPLIYLWNSNRSVLIPGQILEISKNEERLDRPLPWARTPLRIDRRAVIIKRD